MNRIVEQRLSPQYVSVHATDIKTRAYLLGVDESRADISGKLQFLLDNDIEIHAQIVLCPEINDGTILERSLRDLASHYPKVISAAIVPVALTSYNTDERLTRVTPEFCRRTIGQVAVLQKEFRRTVGTTFAFLGDEIYIKGGLEIPSRRHYGNYPQIEDGVGMVRTFVENFERFLNKGGSAGSRARQNGREHADAIIPTGVRQSVMPPAYAGGAASLLTGEMFAPILREQIGKYNAMTGSRLKVIAVPNTYFGGDVSVAGLLSGRDFVAIKDKVVGALVIIPRITIKSDEPIFIDGMTYEDLKAAFDVPVYDLDMAGLIEFLGAKRRAVGPAG